MSYAQAVKKNIFPLLLEGETPWFSVAALHYEDVRNNVLPKPQFYDLLANFVSRRSQRASKIPDADQKAKQMVDSIAI